MKRVGGRFALEREIGSGGMSTVYLGKDEVLNRFVAVKILKAGFDGSDLGDRFRREGRTAARLSHPNVVQVYDAGEVEFDGRRISYIVMEYVSGGDLKGLMDERGRLSERDLTRIGADVAAGLAHAHGRGIVHRDVKPQNILLDEYGAPKLTDFGIARALDATTQTTRTGSYLGTALYSSPEQLRGEEVTSKSDVYSLGATLYHAAVGEPPFSGFPIEVASQQVAKVPEPPRRLGARLGERVEALMMSCLSKDPAERPTADHLRTRLLQAGAASRNTSVGYAGTLKGAGAAGAVRKTLGKEPWPPGAPGGTISLPTRTFRAGSSQRTAFAVLTVALIILALVVAGAWALLSGGGEPAGSAGGQAAEAGEQRDPGSSERGRRDSGPLPPPQQAANAVFNMYVAAVENRFGESWSYLSERSQEQVGSPEQWERRQSSLSRVYFPRSPTAEIVGDKAEVAFSVQETRSGGTETTTGTWICVNEGGEWKLDRLVTDG